MIDKNQLFDPTEDTKEYKSRVLETIEYKLKHHKRTCTFSTFLFISPFIVFFAPKILFPVEHLLNDVYFWLSVILVIAILSLFSEVISLHETLHELDLIKSNDYKIATGVIDKYGKIHADSYSIQVEAFGSFNDALGNKHEFKCMVAAENAECFFKTGNYDEFVLVCSDRFCYTYLRPNYDLNLLIPVSVKRMENIEPENNTK